MEVILHYISQVQGKSLKGTYAIATLKILDPIAADIAKFPCPFLNNTMSDVIKGIFIQTATMVNPITYQKIIF